MIPRIGIGGLRGRGVVFAGLAVTAAIAAGALLLAGPDSASGAGEPHLNLPQQTGEEVRGGRFSQQTGEEVRGGRFSQQTGEEVGGGRLSQQTGEGIVKTADGGGLPTAATAPSPNISSTPPPTFPPGGIARP